MKENKGVLSYTQIDQRKKDTIFINSFKQRHCCVSEKMKILPKAKQNVYRNQRNFPCKLFQ